MVRNLSSIAPQKEGLTTVKLDGKEARAIMQQTADDVDQMKRSSFPNLIRSGCGGSYILQEASHGTTFINGSLHRTRPPITTLRVPLIKRERQTGSFKGVSSPDGSQQTPVHYFGFMANVGPTLPT